MASKDDDTLPLSGFSEELCTDVSIDEDLIPTTQPESSERKKTTSNSDSRYTTSVDEVKSSHYNSGSSIDGTQSLEITHNQTTGDEDKSVDLIPDTEAKETQSSFGGEDFSGKEKLAILLAEESFKDQANTPSESPAVENQSFSIVMGTPTEVPPMKRETILNREDSITEILVNDSIETVNLEQTPVKAKKSQSELAKEESELSCSLTSNAERCEETQIFEYSSVLLLDQASSERSGFSPEKSHLQGTMDDNSQNREGNSSVVAELAKEETKESVPKINGNISLNREVPTNSITTEQNSSSIVTRKIDFKLSVSCFVTVNIKTNKVLQKTILDVDEIPKSKPKSIPFEPISDNTSDKSKRQSTSSSGSVYSDKTGLPFALRKRVSVVSDQTDSSEEEFGLFPKRERKALERIPWGNEYLLPLKMDDIMQVSIENQELLKRPNVIPSPRKPKSRGGGRINHLKEILENTSPERTSTPILESSESQPAETNRLDELLDKEETGTSAQILVTEKKQSEESLESSTQKENASGKENKQCSDREDHVVGEEHESKHQDSVNNFEEVERQRVAEDKNSSVILRDGLPVLARWTDKRYYSGVLSGSGKNDRWDVKFDDGALKAVREDFIIPTEWLKAGALVFALMKDEYVSGQIVNVKEGDENIYIVELDDEKKQVPVKITDLRMTDVMVGLIREKYKPMCCTPRRKTDIDFDNVLSGKRLREQRTPLQPQVTLGKESPGGKKKPSSKAKKNDKTNLEIITETPRNDTGRGTRGLKSENGHLVEDKVISADSPSGNETGGTPLRGTSTELRRKAKPRSLSYVEEIRSGKKISQSYLRSDGTPIPGTSGVKFKKRKTDSKTQKVESPVDEQTTPVSEVKSSSKKIVSSPNTSRSTERSRRKRKLDESVEDSSQKTLPKDGSSRPKRKTRN